ncbi:MAG TPA: glycosyltransferase family A protein [Pseudolabrys sp.]|jgi:glycosyltransferase involved in cell wall biosynthesis|nr:glycosyltransferase family A protein [Pseudolabrys sp.]
MFMSLIICTKDRASQLQRCLDEIAAASIPSCDLEIILVDNGSKDSTNEVIKTFAGKSPVKVSSVLCEKAGLGLARNFGLAAAKGEWLLFTDDDCYVDKSFFTEFFGFASFTSNSKTDTRDIRYGSGPIVPYDELHHPLVASLAVHEIKLIKPKTLIGAGWVQGANMFFHRSIFEKIGPFNDKMGSGTPFACEDIEMAARASLAGFVGAQLPFFKVVHHHKRHIGSAEATSTIESYDYGRGAYYSSLLDLGVPEAWKLWEACIDFKNIKQSDVRLRLAREFEGAAKYLANVKIE